jgi:hypothetical protein
MPEIMHDLGRGTPAGLLTARVTCDQRHASHGNARVGVVGNSTAGCFDDFTV